MESLEGMCLVRPKCYKAQIVLGASDHHPVVECRIIYLVVCSYRIYSFLHAIIVCPYCMISSHLLKYCHLCPALKAFRNKSFHVILQNIHF